MHVHPGDQDIVGADAIEHAFARCRGHNAGLRIFDVRDAFAPKEIASFVTRPPARILDPRSGNKLVPQSCDINVQANGIMYMSNWNGGLHVLKYDG
jgi:hypothetical protein